MISQYILRNYPRIIEACIWLIPISNFFIFGAVSRFEFNFMLGLVGLVTSLIVCSVIAGVILLLIDIHQLLMDIRKTVVK